MRVLVAGGGIGGLTLALMLHARGIRAEIFESAQAVREVGVGINILPHAIREFDALGLLPALDRVGVRTRTLHYLTRGGKEVWSEPRGTFAGHEVPQFSIHRGRLQRLLYQSVLERLGANAVQTGCRLAGFVQDDGGVTAHFANNVDGLQGRTERGDVLICADGIHSAGRRVFYPTEGAPSWNGVVMWRGATVWAPWRDGASIIIGGGLGGKLVLYPIAPAQADGKQLMNWVVNIRTKDPALSPPPPDSWSRRAPLSQVLPHALRFQVPDYDLEALVRATPEIFEYPMADRDPLPRWTFGRVTLLGDAAHPMYPVGSNGASQATLDTRALADALAHAEHPRAALWQYEKDRRLKTAHIVLNNRKGGPEGVIDEIERRAPAGFDDIDAVMSHDERRQMVQGYAAMAGFAKVTRLT